MNLKKTLLFGYGFLMGASTPYLKPKKRFLFPTTVVEIDEACALMLGGSGICAVFGKGAEALVLNTNLGAAAFNWKKALAERSIDETAPLILNSLIDDYAGARDLFPKAREIYSAQNVLNEKRITVGDETVRLIPVGSVVGSPSGSVVGSPMGSPATGSDLVVFLEKRSMLFLGPLFFNRIHPILHPETLKAKAWVECLETLLETLQPQSIVPGEGDLATSEDLRTFIAYLKALMDQSVEFSYCRKNYDWMEIPSQTSLEENFNTLRG